MEDAERYKVGSRHKKTGWEKIAHFLFEVLWNNSKELPKSAFEKPQELREILEILKRTYDHERLYEMEEQYREIYPNENPFVIATYIHGEIRRAVKRDIPQQMNSLDKGVRQTIIDGTIDQIISKYHKQQKKEYKKGQKRHNSVSDKFVLLLAPYLLLFLCAFYLCLQYIRYDKQRKQEIVNAYMEDIMGKEGCDPGKSNEIKEEFHDLVKKIYKAELKYRTDLNEAEGTGLSGQAIQQQAENTAYLYLYHAYLQYFESEEKKHSKK